MFILPIYFLFQNIAAEPPSESLLEKIAILVITSIISVFSTYAMTRRKNEADIAKVIAETVKTYVEAMEEIQGINENLHHCLDSKNCPECIELLTRSLSGLVQIPDLLHDVPEAKEFITNIQNLSVIISDKLKSKIEEKPLEK